MSEQFSLDDLLSQLKQDAQTPERDSNYLSKIRVNSPEYINCTIDYLPVIIPGENKNYIKLDNVLEFNTLIPSFGEGKDYVWMKVLPKEYYEFPSENDEKLYAEIKALATTYEKSYKGNRIFDTLRYRRYSLIPAYILDMTKENAKGFNKKTGASLLIYPSHSPIESLHEAIQLKVNSTKTQSWLPGLLTPEFKNRIAKITTKFYRKENSVAYVTNTSIELNSDYIKVVDPNFDFSDKAPMFSNLLNEFMGWQCIDGKLWNTGLMLELRDAMKRDISKLTSAPAPTPSESPVNEDSATTDAPFNPFLKK